MFCLGMLKRWMCLKLELERRNSEEFETWPETPEYVSSKVGKLKIFRGPSNRSRISPVPPISQIANISGLMGALVLLAMLTTTWTKHAFLRYFWIQEVFPD